MNTIEIKQDHCNIRILKVAAFLNEIWFDAIVQI